MTLPEVPDRRGSSWQPSRRSPRPGPVLVGVRGGPEAEPALRLAADLARAAVAPLVVLHVVEPPRPAALWAAAVGLADLPREDTALEAFVQAASVLDPLRVPWRLLVRQGSAAVALHRAAEELDVGLVVVGAGSGPPSWWRRGTVGHLRRLSARPVLSAECD